MLKKQLFISICTILAFIGMLSLLKSNSINRVVKKKIIVPERIIANGTAVLTEKLPFDSIVFTDSATFIYFPDTGKGDVQKILKSSEKFLLQNVDTLLFLGVEDSSVFTDKSRNHIIQIHKPSNNLKSRWVENPIFQLWIFLASSLVAVSVGCFFYLYRKIKHIRKRSDIPPKVYWVYLLISVGIATIGLVVQNYFSEDDLDFISLISNHHILLKYPENILNSVFLVFGIVPVMCITTMFLTAHGLFYSNQKTMSDSEYDDNFIPHFIWLKNISNNTLLIISLFLAWFVFNAASLRYAIITEIGPGEVFPVEFVYLFGGFYSFLVAFIYIPTHHFFNQVGGKIIHHINPIEQLVNTRKNSPIEHEKLHIWNDNNKILLRTLQINNSLESILKAVLGILAPAIASLLSGILI